jgi:hypothetical protein
MICSRHGPGGQDTLLPAKHPLQAARLYSKSNFTWDYLGGGVNRPTLIIFPEMLQVLLDWMTEN